MQQQPTRISGDGPQYIGKRLLVGITVNSAEGEFLYQEQFHGLIVEADDGGLVVERADNGARVSLPPELVKAKPGEYRLRSTGEVVVDPDYLAKWAWTEGGPEQKAAGGAPPAA
jgi:hypothetical protein